MNSCVGGSYHPAEAVCESKQVPILTALLPDTFLAAENQA